MVRIFETSCCHNRCCHRSASWLANCLSSSKCTCHCLCQVTPECFPPDLRPPNSPNLNPLDYRVRGCHHDRVYQKHMHDVDELKQCLVKVWLEFRQTIVDDAIDEWRKRLWACVRAKGHHFEHRCKLNVVISMTGGLCC